MVDSNAETVVRCSSAFGGWNGATLPLLWLLRLCTEMVVLPEICEDEDDARLSEMQR